VVPRVAVRGVVSGRLLARRWPRANMTQIGGGGSGHLTKPFISSLTLWW
jgi:hypothetical protein